MGRLGTPAHVSEVRRLYKSVLRLQRGLPRALQETGTPFIRDEWRRHRDVREEKLASDFLHEWSEYCRVLSRQLSLAGIVRGQIGRHLSVEEVERLSDELAGQLYELKLETEKPKS